MTREEWPELLVIQREMESPLVMLDLRLQILQDMDFLGQDQELDIKTIPRVLEIPGPSTLTLMEEPNRFPTIGSIQMPRITMQLEDRAEEERVPPRVQGRIPAPQPGDQKGPIVKVSSTLISIKPRITGAESKLAKIGRMLETTGTTKEEPPPKPKPKD